MRMAARVLLCAVAVLVPGLASATTLTITDGVANLLPIFAHSAHLAGDGFSVLATSNLGAPTDRAFGAEDFVFTMVFAGANSAQVEVGEATCVNAQTYPPSSVDCGRVTLRSPGLASPPSDWPRTVPYIATVPFVATGFLNVGGSRFDLFGQGMLTGTVCLAVPVGECPVTLPTPYLRYTFSAAEPASVALTMLFAAALVGLGVSASRGRAEQAPRA